MTVSAAAPFVVVLVVVSATATTAALAASATSFAAHAVDDVLYLFVCSGAAFHYRTLEVQCLTSQRVVQVNLHLIGTNLSYTCHEALSLFVLQRNDGIFHNVLVVEAAVDGEYLFVKINHVLVDIFAISLFGCELEVEFGTLLQCCYSLFKAVECDAEARDKYERLICGSLFYQCGTLVVDGLKLVGHCYKLVVVLFHCFIMIFFVILLSKLYCVCKSTTKYSNYRPFSQNRCLRTTRGR